MNEVTNFTFNSGVLSYLTSLLYAKGIKNNKTILIKNYHGNCELITNFDNIKQTLLENNARIVNDYSSNYLKNSMIAILNDGSVMQVSKSSVDYYSLNDNDDLLKKILKENYSLDVPKNNIYCVLSSDNGLTLSPLKNHHHDVENDNYDPETIKSYNYIVEHLNSKKPKGRIAIFLGEPGTGKTYLIRSIIKDLSKCICVMIPPNMVQSLDKPEFLQLLISKNFDRPIVFIIEDGDVCLSPRKADNMSTISSLLNLGDGILGSLLDLRFIITSNADIAELDQAIIRPGRLCKKVEVNLLQYEQANKVFKRLKNSEEVNLEFKKFYSLAEVYALAYDEETKIEPKISDKKKIGFIP